MLSNTDTGTEVRVRIQDTLVSINDMALKIKKELDMIKELVKEDGQLCRVLKTANERLSDKVDEMGLNVMQIVSKARRKDKSDQDLLGPVTSTAIMEELLSQMDDS